MIELKQVTFQYDNAPENAHSIRNINLTIQNGECVVLCGRSGCGKTTVTLAVLRAMQRRKIPLAAFKCGPDYIDPMFHRSALGVESHNLDLYLSAPDTVRTLTPGMPPARRCRMRGCHGLYDGRD